MHRYACKANGTWEHVVFERDARLVPQIDKNLVGYSRKRRARKFTKEHQQKQLTRQSQENLSHPDENIDEFKEPRHQHDDNNSVSFCSTCMEKQDYLEQIEEFIYYEDEISRTTDSEESSVHSESLSNSIEENGSIMKSQKMDMDHKNIYNVEIKNEFKRNNIPKSQFSKKFIETKIASDKKSDLKLLNNDDNTKINSDLSYDEENNNLQE